MNAHNNDWTAEQEQQFLTDVANTGTASVKAIRAVTDTAKLIDTGSVVTL